MDKKELISEMKKMDTASISDAMDKLGIHCGLLGIQAVVEGTKSVEKHLQFTTFHVVWTKEMWVILLTM